MKRCFKRLFSCILTLCMVVGLFAAIPLTASAQGDTSTVVSSGATHTLALKGDGTLWAWGSNEHGQLGIGRAGGIQATPVKIMDNVVAVSAGENYSMAITSNSSLWGWGENSSGQLGNGKSGGQQYAQLKYDEGIDESSPVKIMDNVASVSAHTDHTAAVKTDGTLWVWGENAYGQIGNEKTSSGFYDGLIFNEGIDENVPVKIMDGVASASTGLISTYAVKLDGTLWGWGAGNLGTGEIGGIQVTPVKITEDVKTIYTGASGTPFIIKTDNSLWGWGSNHLGLMGTGTTSATDVIISEPIKIMDNVVSISGNRFALAVKTDNSLWIWGDMLWGNVAGDGVITERECTSTKVMDNVAAASAGLNRATVIKQDGTLWTWGTGGSGELGNGYSLPQNGIATEADAVLTPMKIADGFSTGSQQPTVPVADTPSSWAVEQVNAAITAGFVPNSLQSKYTQATTRAEFCALAVTLYETVSNAEITERSTFSDTTDINVEKMAALGVVTGVGDNRFSPGRALTRQEAATMLSRLAAAIGKPLTGQSLAFVDHASIASWASDAVGQMQATGIMGGVGDNTFSPQGAYTREQSIVTILRLFDMIGSTNGLISGLTAAPPETEKPEATPEPTPSESTDSFDWVDIATTYDSILRPYAESLGFECEYSQAVDILGNTRYYLYFTKGEMRITVAPLSSLGKYNYLVGKPDDSVAQSRIEESASIQSCTSSSAIKDVLKSAS